MLWNIAPSMGQTYKFRESELVPIPHYCLHVVKKLGTCHLGEVNVCDLDGREGQVAVRSMNGDCVRELRFLCSLSDSNVVRTLGVCTAEKPPWAVMEYPAELGDLVHLLKTNSNTK